MSKVITNNSESVVILELPDHTTEKELSCIVSMESLKFPVEMLDEGVTLLGVTTFASYVMIISKPQIPLLFLMLTGTDISCPAEASMGSQ